MSQAPQSLPFALQPSPPKSQTVSPQKLAILKQQVASANQRYISSICRTGPISNTRLTVTDLPCLIIYILLLLTTIILFCINYFNGNMIKNPNITQLSFFSFLFYTLHQIIPQTLLTCLCLIALGIIIIVLTIIIPYIMGFIILISCLGMLGFSLYSLLNTGYLKIFQNFSNNNYINQSSNLFWFKIAFIVFVSIGILIHLYLILMRIKKIKHIPQLMSVLKIVLLQSFPILPLFILFLLSGINIGVWVGFCTMLWNMYKIYLSNNMTIPPFLLIIFGLILWIWTHGFLIAISDYICQSWVLHWYFNANEQNKQQQHLNNINIYNNSNTNYINNAQRIALKSSWRSQIFMKLVKYHLGTCLFSSFSSAYLSQNIIKLIKKSTNKLIIGYLSKYSHIQTILQGFSYYTANKQMYNLRQRIKTKIPQIYMLGHFLQRILKITLIIVSIYLLFVISYSINGFLSQNISLFSIFMFIIVVAIVVFGLFLEIITNIGNLIGIISDTAVIVYCIDCQIQRVHYHKNSDNSCPQKLKNALKKLQMDVVIFEGHKQNSQVNNYQFNNNLNVNTNNSDKYPNLHSYYENQGNNNNNQNYLGNPYGRAS